MRVISYALGSLAFASGGATIPNHVERSAQTCNSALVKTVRAQFTNADAFCQFYASEPRNASALDGVSSADLLSACNCVLQYDRLTVPALTCTPRYATTIKANFKQPKPFCKLYLASSQQFSPISTLTPVQVVQGCKCILPVTSTTITTTKSAKSTSNPVVTSSSKASVSSVSKNPTTSIIKSSGISTAKSAIASSSKNLSNPIFPTETAIPAPASSAFDSAITLATTSKRSGTTSSSSKTTSTTSTITTPPLNALCSNTLERLPSISATAVMSGAGPVSGIFTLSYIAVSPEPFTFKTINPAFATAATSWKATASADAAAVTCADFAVSEAYGKGLPGWNLALVESPSHDVASWLCSVWNATAETYWDSIAVDDLVDCSFMYYAHSPMAPVSNATRATQVANPTLAAHCSNTFPATITATTTNTNLAVVTATFTKKYSSVGPSPTVLRQPLAATWTVLGTNGNANDVVASCAAYVAHWQNSSKAYGWDLHMLESPPSASSPYSLALWYCYAYDTSAVSQQSDAYYSNYTDMIDCAFRYEEDKPLASQQPTTTSSAKTTNTSSKSTSTAAQVTSTSAKATSLSTTSTSAAAQTLTAVSQLCFNSDLPLVWSAVTSASGKGWTTATYTQSYSATGTTAMGLDMTLATTYTSWTATADANAAAATCAGFAEVNRDATVRNGWTVELVQSGQAFNWWCALYDANTTTSNTFPSGFGDAIDCAITYEENMPALPVAAFCANKFPTSVPGTISIFGGGKETISFTESYSTAGTSIMVLDSRVITDGTSWWATEAAEEAASTCADYAANNLNTVSGSKWTLEFHEVAGNKPQWYCGLYQTDAEVAMVEGGPNISCAFAFEIDNNPEFA